MKRDAQWAFPFSSISAPSARAFVEQQFIAIGLVGGAGAALRLTEGDRGPLLRDGRGDGMNVADVKMERSRVYRG